LAARACAARACAAGVLAAAPAPSCGSCRRGSAVDVGAACTGALTGSGSGVG
jgi:hypothetical protein